ncbi:hypothetical protein Anapl_10008 [Anas platyrhynchos]|uniref:Uncharacterized protein n=1 Tax=Anas platyrhynchos TaxID=8839 RepID=R0KBL9_ANAPL|nr:hypothetical protein Anapl_10008 [Anas platyrhynchos]
MHVCDAPCKLISFAEKQQFSALASPFLRKAMFGNLRRWKQNRNNMEDSLNTSKHACCLCVRMPFGRRSTGAAGTSLSESVPNCEGAVSQTRRRNEVSFSPGQGLGAIEFPSWRSEDITSNCQSNDQLLLQFGRSSPGSSFLGELRFASFTDSDINFQESRPVLPVVQGDVSPRMLVEQQRLLA